MNHYSIFLILFFLIAAALCNNLKKDEDDNKDWDYLIFTQHWPVTVCTEWHDKNPSNTCNIPNNTWTIHGIWPTKIGTEGPSFCNKTWHFDPEQLKPFEDSLEQLWTNVEANTKPTALWKHEWTKHGTCAAQIEPLDSESKYFMQGINWVQKYNISVILSENMVVPGQNSYTVENIHDAIHKSLGKNPIIQCVNHKKTKLLLLSEIRLCFDKKLELVDCDMTKDFKGNWSFMNVLTNCKLNSPIQYYDKAPDAEVWHGFVPDDTYVDWLHKQLDYLDRLKQLYKVIEFLNWMTTVSTRFG